MIRLTRSDSSRNMHRYYALQLAPTLFGEWSLVTEWGRIGAPGKVGAAESEAQKRFGTHRLRPRQLPQEGTFIPMTGDLP
jgi:predicted DNA-binding WGR domain protein